MTPNMSLDEMLDSFIYVVKGSRVLDRFSTDWSRWLWLEEKYFGHLVYTVGDLKGYFARNESRRRFAAWMENPHRMSSMTIGQAVWFAADLSRGNFVPRIDVGSMINKGNPGLWWQLPSKMRQ